MLNLLKEADDKTLISITPEWLEQKFDEMNKLLFNGVLYRPRFGLFTSGKGSRGGTLGWFKINKDSNVIWKPDRVRGGFWAYVRDGWGDSFLLQPKKFVYYMHPLIQLNGNYRWTEKAALSTLVHEMCHYYVHRNGYWPKQSHGPEFMSVARMVSQKSNEFFTVERLARAEQMSEMDLSDEMKAFNNRRAAAGIHFFKIELSGIKYRKRVAYRFAYAIPAQSILDNYRNYIKSNFDPSRYSKVVECVTTDGTIKRYSTVKVVGKWYFTNANSIDEVLGDVKVESEEPVELGGDITLSEAWYLFTMKYKKPYRMSGRDYPWAYYISKPGDFYAFRNYLTTRESEFSYADYYEINDGKILGHKASKPKELSINYLSQTDDILPKIKKGKHVVIFDNQANAENNPENPLATFLYGNGGNPHLKAAQQPKRYSFTMKVMGADGKPTTFTITNATEEEAKQQLHQRFPKWSDVMIDNKFKFYTQNMVGESILGVDIQYMVGQILEKITQHYVLTDA